MVFLTVPYAEKDAAKALGARWNPTRRRWYVPDGAATEPFAKWLDAGPGEGKASRASASPSGRVDSYQGKTVVGTNFVALTHDCNPFEPCPVCSAQLAGTPWMQAQAALRDLVGGLAGAGGKRTAGTGAS